MLQDQASALRALFSAAAPDAREAAGALREAQRLIDSAAELLARRGRPGPAAGRLRRLRSEIDGIIQHVHEDTK